MKAGIKKVIANFIKLLNEHALDHGGHYFWAWPIMELLIS